MAWQAAASSTARCCTNRAASLRELWSLPWRRPAQSYYCSVPAGVAAPAAADSSSTHETATMPTPAAGGERVPMSQLALSQGKPTQGSAVFT
eukprot:COSAG01_NODE_1250_length_11058_cov_35.299845_7_plen_92_part_00